MKGAIPILVTLLAIVPPMLGDKCVPGHNCKPPDCRCWNDKRIPGGVSREDTPQMVLLTFSYAMNAATLGQYTPIFKALKNPNGCPPKGTFFTQKLNTDPYQVKLLYEKGHEIALTSSDGTIPKSKSEWTHSLQESSSKLISAGIPKHKLRGVRSPQEFMGGNSQLEALKKFGSLYDASCVTHKYDDDKTLWPFTYDFVDGTPKCDIGHTPNKSFAGLWQFMVPDLSVGDRKCSVLSGCSPFINDSSGALKLLEKGFMQHYTGNRTPLVLFIDAQWMATDYQVVGLRQFLEVLGHYDDVWMVTMSQALDWIQKPKAMKKHTQFAPWGC